MTAKKTDSVSYLIPHYRPDIDGLRAIAVLSVVLYHAFPTLLPGGFIGVDLFFVISGFLISNILYSELEQGQFSIIRFYGRRIRRIFPALILVLISCWLAGWFILFADEYLQLGKHMAAGASFASNLVLWGESSYFDNAAETKPLLHLWSLGVEEQYYLFWPLLILFAWKQFRNIPGFIFFLLIISFVWNVVNIRQDPISTFYSPLSRFWELLFGALLAYIVYQSREQSLTVDDYTFVIRSHVRRLRVRVGISVWDNFLSLLGALFFLTGVFLIDKFQAFPGWWALLPVLGAFFIIAAGPNGIINRAVLSSRLLVWVGLISYPLYLWHWPLLSFLHIFESGLPSKILLISAVTLSFILAWLTYWFIERPIRFYLKSKIITVLLVILMVCIGGWGLLTFLVGGFQSRFDGSLLSSQKLSQAYEIEKKKFDNSKLESDQYTKACDFFSFTEQPGIKMQPSSDGIPLSCYQYSDQIPKRVLVWGDSHAQMLHYGIKNSLPNDWQLLQIARAACPPSVSDLPITGEQKCQKTNAFAAKEIARIKPQVVVLAQRDSWSSEQIGQITAFLKSNGVDRIIFIGKSPEWNADLPKILMRKMQTDASRYSWVGVNREVISSNLKVKEAFSKINDAQFVDVIDLFCNENGCMVYLGEFPDLGITSFDTNHLTPRSSQYLADQLLIPAITLGK
jgi:peptidoglycan/LPS O-acetylase OafA/YrhL